MKSQRSVFAFSGLAAGSFGGLGGPGMVVNPGLGADAKSRKYGKIKASEDDSTFMKHTKYSTVQKFGISKIFLNVFECDFMCP